MIRDEDFLVSRRPYAVDLGSLETTPPSERGSTWGMVAAVWFRRRRGLTVACIGVLTDVQDAVPADAAAFLAAYVDGCIGGRCLSRWDGANFWTTAGDPDRQQAHLAVLKPMLAAYPAVPDGYDGWWRF